MSAKTVHRGGARRRGGSATASAGTIGGMPIASERAPYAVAARQLLRDTLFGAARDELHQRAWSEVTMADIASAAGVSRQTLYKEFGTATSSPGVRDPRGTTLPRRGRSRRCASTSTIRARRSRAALEVFLAAAGEDPLVRILLSDDGTAACCRSSRRRDAGGSVGDAAGSPRSSSEGWPQAPADNELLAESLVRLAISHVTAPSDTPEATAENAGQLLGPFIDEALGEAPGPSASSDGE